MSYDYLDDLFRKNYKTGDKYVQVEQETIRLLVKINEKKVTFDEIDQGFLSIRKQLLEVDNTVVDEGSPSWLFYLLSFHFLKWHDWHVLRKMHDEHPEKFNTEELEQAYQEIVSREMDADFIDKCCYCLSELNTPKVKDALATQ